MDEALELADYLPVSYRSSSEEAYIRFLWESFESNYESGKFEFSCLAFHLLYMSFVSFSLWRIRHVREQDFKNALIGFQSPKEADLLNANTPFKFFEKLKEAEIFRFFKLLGCENHQVGEFAKFLKNRNQVAHPTGTVLFNDQNSIDTEIRKMIREVANIQACMQPVVLEVYGQFLRGSADPDARQYAEPAQEIEINFIHQNYISRRDIEACLAFDLSPLRVHADFPQIETLHQSLSASYAVE
jgi:hypothetical protein